MFDESRNLSGAFEGASSFVIPTIYEDDENGRRMGYDIYSRMLKDGVVILNGPVSEQSAANIVAQMLFLDRNFVPKNDQDMITFFINSPGGSVTAGMSIYDTMMRMNKPVRTICTGVAASMGSFLLQAGAPDERYALPNAEVMIHEGAAGTRGKITEMDNMNQVFLNTNDRLIKFYNFHTGIPEEELRGMMERKDTFMNAEEAKALGLVDYVGYEPAISEAELQFGITGAPAVIPEEDVEAAEPAKTGARAKGKRKSKGGTGANGVKGASTTGGANAQTGASGGASTSSTSPVTSPAEDGDKPMFTPHQQWLRDVYAWKKQWGAFTQELNLAEAARRGQPRAPAINDNIMEIAQKRKAPGFGKS